MPTKNEQQQLDQPNDIAIIRNILMGQQMAEYEQHFAQVEAVIEANKADIDQRLAAFGQQTDERFLQLEREINERFERLEKSLNENIRRLDAKLFEVTKTDKQNLGQMLADLSKKLIVE